MKSLSSGTIPPVSTTRNSCPRHSASPYRRSRVMPDSSPTMARRDPVRWLNSVDLPTLGRPTMATSGVDDLREDARFVIRRAFSFPEFVPPRWILLATGYWQLGTVYYRDSVPSSSHPVSPPETRSAGFSLYQFFAPGGVLSKTHPAYEFRRGQLQMAQAVEEALEEKRHLIVEAGTGTGKTLAYLLPVIRSGKRVIVSTGTKNLQEQLF